MSLAARFDLWEAQWLQEGEKKGEQKGLKEGQTGLLQRQLVRRFGPLPQDMLQRLNTATTDDLEHWADRVLDAHSLDEVFAAR